LYVKTTVAPIIDTFEISIDTNQTSTVTTYKRMHTHTHARTHTPPFLHISSFAPPVLQFPPVTVSQDPLVVQLTIHDPVNKKNESKNDVQSSLKYKGQYSFQGWEILLENIVK